MEDTGVENIDNGMSRVNLADDANENNEEMLDPADLPNILIVTNVADAVFDEEKARVKHII